MVLLCLSAALCLCRTGPTTRPQQRWVPYRHSNGLAIYKHQSRTRGEAPEYLVSLWAATDVCGIDIGSARPDPWSPGYRFSDSV